MSKKRRKKKKQQMKRRAGEALQRKTELQESMPKPAPRKPATEAEQKKNGSLIRMKPILVFSVILIVVALAAFLVIRSLKPAIKIKRDSQMNVLLVTLDTTRADGLGCYGSARARTPNLDGLAAAGVRFENVYCQVPLTTPSHCSILTGTYPLYHQVHNNGSYGLPAELTTLAEVFKGRGFQTVAFVASFTVDSRFGLAQGFDVYDDRLTEGEAFKPSNAERKADKVYAAFRGWLDSRGEGPFFCWVHFYDPHVPYDPPAPYSIDFADSPYDGEIAYMDHYVGQVVAALREKGLLQNTLVVLAGDHGEAFGEKVEVGHGVFLYDGTLRVPMIFSAEDRLPKGAVIRPRVRLIDIVPSVLDMLEVPPPTEVQGQSLLPYITGQKSEDLDSYVETYFPRENYGWSELVGLIEGDWKYIRAPKPELYNLKTDPEETDNAFGREGQRVQEMRSRLEETIAASSSGFASSKRELTSEEREKLRSLGYVDKTADAPSGPLPDPKDMVEELRMSQKAEILEMEGDFREAAEVYGRILELNPQSPVNYVNLALVEAKMDRFDEAVRILERGIAAIPGSVTLLSRLAHTYMVMGRLQKSLDAWQAVLVIDPEYFDGLLASGWILDLMGKKEEARGFLEKAREVEPENRFLRKTYAMNLAVTGNLKEAIAVYESLKQENPADPEVLQDLGIAYGYTGDINRAIENLKAAVDLQPNPTAYYNLTVALKKVGNIEEAAKYLRLYLANPEGEPEEKIRGAQQELLVLEKLLQ
ncbi:MAG: sulfatase-like hydrolase/transferase [Candidatus Aminicenantales bacterium]